MALSVKIQHPANNIFKYWAQRQNIAGNYHTDKETTSQGTLVCSYSDPGILVGENQGS